MAATSGAPLNAELLRASKIIPDVVDEVCEPFLDMRVIYRKKSEVLIWMERSGGFCQMSLWIR